MVIEANSNGHGLNLPKRVKPLDSALHSYMTATNLRNVKDKTISAVILLSEARSYRQNSSFEGEVATCRLFFDLFVTIARRRVDSLAVLRCRPEIVAVFIKTLYVIARWFTRLKRIVVSGSSTD